MSKKFLLIFFLYGNSFKLSITHCFILDTFSNTFSFVENGIIKTSWPNLVLAKTLRNAAVLDSTCFWFYNMSALFNTTINFLTNSYAIIMHYAVWVWMPFVISTTSNIISMICAPPMIVFSNEPWPGQSTKVNCKYCSFALLNFSGILVRKAEKPRSRVMPRYWDWGFLSKDAVDVISLNILHNEVFPESTCPNTPTLMLIQLVGSILACYYLDTWRLSCSIVISDKDYS